ncbi:MAG: ATP-binding cassette domain-containing protein, partial [Defluviitaleaceae bacterium]|nr:ATP-binding cassette domain-containing protein [Defluviitaleaceae bacterium]
MDNNFYMNTEEKNENEIEKNEFENEIEPPKHTFDENDIIINIKDASCYYGKNIALKNVNLQIPKKCIYAFIGPSGCGKTTLLRSINRLNDLVPAFKLTGTLAINGKNVYDIKKQKEIMELRKNIGMIFQQPNPLPTSILKNMLLPVREHYYGRSEYFHEKVVEK